MERGWDKSQLERIFANGEHVLQTDYYNLKTNTIGGLNKISLLRFPNGEYQFIIEDKNARLMNYDGRFTSNLIQTVFKNPPSYICKSVRTSDKDELQSLVESISNIEDIAEIELDLCLIINPNLTDEDILAYFNFIEEHSVFDEALKSIYTIREYAPYLEPVIHQLAENYINKGMLSKAFAIYELILDNDIVIQKAQDLLNGIQDGSYMAFGESEESAEQFKNHLIRIINFVPQEDEENDLEIKSQNPNL